MKPSNRIDSVVLLLVGLVILYTGIILWTAIYLKSDGQTFQIVSNLASGFAGALLMRINPTKTTPVVDPDASIKKTVDTHVETTSPKE